MTVVAAALIVLAGCAARLLGDAHPRVWAIWPFTATGLIVALDFLGHTGRDEILVQLAHVLIRGSRATDVVSLYAAADRRSTGIPEAAKSRP